jgi:hypothetical protein
MAEAAAPDLTVVIPSVNGWSDLEHALAALRAQTAGPVMEIIVVDRVGEQVRERLARCPDVHVVEAPAMTTIPEMRRMGFDAARSPVVGVIEDHILVPPDWALQMLEEHRDGALVVGGSVENAACERLIDRAAFLCEYSHCLSPPEGESDWLTGNNVTYRRDLLQRFADIIALGRWEDHLHAGMRGAGIALVSRPAIRVGHRKHYTIREYTSQRYLYARAYAGMRVEHEPGLRRAAYGAGAFALPPLLLYRILSRTTAAGVPRMEIARSLPLLALFVSAWALGEVVGYWRGHGNTLARVC